MSVRRKLLTYWSLRNIDSTGTGAAQLEIADKSKAKNGG